MMFYRLLNRQKNKKAFTLAEVLIVLGIIGMIAEMTIPTLMQNVQTQVYKTSWKKAVSVANQAYMMAVTDNGGGFGAYSCSDASAYNKWHSLKSKMSIIKECNNNDNAGNCWGATTNPDVGSGCGRWQNASINYNSTFITKDGIAWMPYGNDAIGYCAIVAVDVNGAKGPNKWGVDAFSFQMNDTEIGGYGGCTNDGGNSVNYLYQ